MFYLLISINIILYLIIIFYFIFFHKKFNFIIGNFIFNNIPTKIHQLTLHNIDRYLKFDDGLDKIFVSYLLDNLKDFVTIYKTSRTAGNFDILAGAIYQNLMGIDIENKVTTHFQIKNTENNMFFDSFLEKLIEGLIKIEKSSIELYKVFVEKQKKTKKKKSVFLVLLKENILENYENTLKDKIILFNDLKKELNQNLFFTQNSFSPVINSNFNKNELEKLIAENEIKKVINILLNSLNTQTTVYQIATLISARFNEYNTNNLKGLAVNEEQLNKIKDDLYNLLKHI